MGAIHDWDDDDAIKILDHCRRAMAPNGKVLVVETVVILTGTGSEFCAQIGTYQLKYSSQFLAHFRAAANGGSSSPSIRFQSGRTNGIVVTDDQMRICPEGDPDAARFVSG